MAQTVLTYVIVVIAALWVGWSVLLPNRLRRKLRLKYNGKSPKAEQTSGCGSGACSGCDS